MFSPILYGKPILGAGVTKLVSFIIPALNEEKNIGHTLTSIQQACALAKLQYEVILADHSSRDRTREIAEAMGAKVVLHSGGTIAELRNEGAKRASGSVFVFLDADVTLTTAWAENINPVLNRVEREALITGSHCSPPDSKNWLLKYWFGSFALDSRNTHLGTGHMIISASRFNALGGFNRELRTGEDYEFCERALAGGASIINETALRVIHHDFPKTIRDFVRREAWHGRGDLGSIKTMIRSKVAVSSIVFLALHLFALVSAMFCQSGVTVFFVMLIGLLLVASSAFKNRHADIKTIVINAAIFYWYYVGRSLALIKRIAK